MISVLFYILYAALSVSPFFLIFSNNVQNKIYLLLPLIFTAQFNVTAFAKTGLTISFFEITLLLATICILISDPCIIPKIKFQIGEKVFAIFLCFSLVSILVALVRFTFFDLRPNSYMPIHPSIRSLMSLNKVFVYVPSLAIIRQYLANRFTGTILNNFFFRAMALSGVPPTIAAFIQYSGIGFYLIHNNSSFAETFRVEEYLGTRLAGLTNEASFFSYQLFFSFIAVWNCLSLKLLGKYKAVILMLLYSTAVLLSLSRTGFLIFLIYIVYRLTLKNFSLRKFAIGCIALLLVILFLKDIRIGNFNIGDRFISSFRKEADVSTIERYGITEALFKLGISKSPFVGIGIFNYQYYIKAYLPPYFKGIIQYSIAESPPSFNFVLQLIVEFGVFFFVLFFAPIVALVRKSVLFVKEWFFFLFVFALSFQVLNFSVPFLIVLFMNRSNEDRVPAG